MSDLQKQIFEKVELLSKFVDSNGADDPLMSFLLDHLCEFSDDLAEKYADKLESETEMRDQEED